MCYKICFTALFLFTASHIAQAQDTLKNRFSIGFGKTYVNYYFQAKPNEVIQNNPRTGVYAKLDFMWKRFGFSTGLQFMNRSYYEKFPETTQQYRILGYKHASSVRAMPLYLSYRLLDKKRFRIFGQAGMVYSKINDFVNAEFNYSPVYSKPYETTRFVFSWSTGLDVEVNLYKRDLWLSTQLQYVGEPFHGQNHKRLLFNIGLKIDLSDILHKDAVKSLKLMKS